MNNVAGVLGTGPSLFPLAMSLQVNCVAHEDQLQKSTSGEGMAVGTWLRSIVSIPWKEIRGGLIGEGNSEFLGKIRKRREKILGKGLLETSRFERELKRLECSVNYEGDTKEERPYPGSKRKVIKSVIRNQKVDLFCIQETKMQVMSEEVVRSLGLGRFLDWRVLNAMGTAGGVLIYWDKRLLEIWVWKRANFPSPVDSEMWEMKGSGCLWGSMVLSPEKKGSACGSGGLNNQSRTKLDRFLATPNWLDQYSRVYQRRLFRPTSDHFPFCLRGRAKERFFPFQFENMWLKAEGFKDLIRGVEVFGRLERNKAEALQQVERWDLVEEERSFNRGGIKPQKGSQGGLCKVGVDGRSALETAIKGIMAKGRG
ncbi:hypothetical protein CK203_044479 [Vitis vinifera]|uniref:Endonuclease/exonuclease/phosphatase domain-containing protein n=1 Tax=Vitis vinifera TaxID=29760 RepID=A0A438HB24_VITVI|nr:hypothetical protein CK203_044479 [Vitis vinifera]